MASKRKSKKGPGRPPAGKRGMHVSRDYKAMTVRMPPGIKRSVVAEAKRNGKSLSEVIVLRVDTAAKEAAARLKAEAEAAAQRAAHSVFIKHMMMLSEQVEAHRRRVLDEHAAGRIDADEMSRQLRTLMTNFRTEWEAAQDAYQEALESALTTARRVVREGQEDDRTAAG